ncbi:MAG: hypothetical protein WB560_03520 [Desulfobaccales bacterium]
MAVKDLKREAMVIASPFLRRFTMALAAALLQMPRTISLKNPMAVGFSPPFFFSVSRVFRPNFSHPALAPGHFHICMAQEFTRPQKRQGHD